MGKGERIHQEDQAVHKKKEQRKCRHDKRGEGMFRDVPGGGQVPKRANTPRQKPKAGADSAAAQGRRGAEPAEHFKWCRL